MSYDTFLPGLADYCNAEEAVMLINRKGKIHTSSYKKEFVRSLSDITGKHAEYLKLKLGGTADGDEYVIVAVNVSPEEVRQIQTDWKAALDRLNEEDKEMFCSMACGVSYGSGDYDYDELYANADKLMYDNKKALKANNITSHIVS